MLGFSYKLPGKVLVLNVFWWSSQEGIGRAFIGKFQVNINPYFQWSKFFYFSQIIQRKAHKYKVKTNNRLLEAKLGVYGSCLKISEKMVQFSNQDAILESVAIFQIKKGSSFWYQAPSAFRCKQSICF